MSASGTFHQGNHIFDPRTGKNSGVSEFDRIWVASKKAAYSDAFATGFFLQSVKEIENIPTNTNWLALSPDYRTIVTSDDNRRLKLWDYNSGRKIVN